MMLKFLKEDGQYHVWIDPVEVVAVHELPPDNFPRCMVAWRGGVTTVRGRAEDVLRDIEGAKSCR